MNNRTVLYRAKHSETGEWIKGDYFKKSIYYPGSRSVALEHYIGWQVSGDGETYNEYVEINPGNLCQYAGEMFGTEIWEGDIGEHPDGLRFVVVWDENFLGFRAQYLKNPEDGTYGLHAQLNPERGQAKIIGSIHDAMQEP